MGGRGARSSVKKNNTQVVKSNKSNSQKTLDDFINDGGVDFKVSRNSIRVTDSETGKLVRIMRNSSMINDLPPGAKFDVIKDLHKYLPKVSPDITRDIVKSGDKYYKIGKNGKLEALKQIK